MKVRFLIEVEIDNEALLRFFGEQYAMMLASHALEQKLAGVIMASLREVPHIKEAQATMIPAALRTDKLVG